MATDNRPLLNPVLSLRIDPRPEGVSGRGKSLSMIKQDRLPGQRIKLNKQIDQLEELSEGRTIYNGFLPVSIEMFEDAFAATKTPHEFFTGNANARIVSPLPRGYLVEIPVAHLPRLSAAALNDDSTASCVDLSNITSIKPFAIDDLSNQSIDDIWKQALPVQGGRLIRIRFLPHRDRGARQEVMAHLNQQLADGVFSAIDTRRRDATPGVADSDSSIAVGMRNYRNTPRGHATVLITSLPKLQQLNASGAVFRFDPVRQISATSPGTGAEPVPDPDTPAALNYPVVGVIDGGLKLNRYNSQIAWEAEAYVPDGDADKVHGNEIASLIIQGYAWNNNLNLAPLNCRIGVAQAIAKKGSTGVYTTDSFLWYFESLIKAHTDVKVWNLSFNEDVVCEEDEFSDLGHRIAEIARKHDVLPVISAGNREDQSINRLYPPADCEAGITVAGRNSDDNGDPDGVCGVSCEGPAPQLLLKPEASAHSTVRVIGGKIVQGSSYAAANISPIAAHTFDNLRDATPDLVKALLINNGDIGEFCPARGWGTPLFNNLPWMCSDGSVTLAWTDELQAGKSYYWEDIPITDAMIKDGGLYGSATLTAILNPKGMVTQGSGANYFSCRVSASLQYLNNQASRKNLFGKMNLDQVSEQEARSDYKKWNPVRHYHRDFTNKPLLFTGDTFRVYARVYARDLYQYNLTSNEDIRPMPVAFVLTLKSAENNNSTVPLYSEMTTSLGNFVESAVVEQDININV